MQAEIGPAPGGPPGMRMGVSSGDHSLGNAHILLNEIATAGLSNKSAIKQEARDLRTFTNEFDLSFLSVISQVDLQVQKSKKVKNMVTGKEEIVDTIVSPQGIPVETFTWEVEAGGNIYTEVVEKYRSVAKSPTDVNAVWVSFRPETAEKIGSNNRIYKLEKKGKDVTLTSYTAGGSEESMWNFMDEISGVKYDRNDSLHSKTAFFSPHEDNISHQKIYKTLLSSLTGEEQNISNFYLNKFQAELKINDQQRSEINKQKEEKFAQMLNKTMLENNVNNQTAFGILAQAIAYQVRENRSQTFNNSMPADHTPIPIQDRKIEKAISIPVEIADTFADKKLEQNKNQDVAILAAYERKRKRKKDIIPELPEEKPEKPSEKQTEGLRVFEEFVQHSSNFQELAAESDTEFRQSRRVQEIPKPVSPILAEYERKRKKSKEIIPKVAEIKTPKLIPEKETVVKVFKDTSDLEKGSQNSETEKSSNQSDQKTIFENVIVPAILHLTENLTKPAFESKNSSQLTQTNSTQAEQIITPKSEESITISNTIEHSKVAAIDEVQLKSLDDSEKLETIIQQQEVATLIAGILLLQEDSSQKIKSEQINELPQPRQQEAILVPAIIYLSELIKESNQDNLETQSPNPQEILKDTKIIESDPEPDSDFQKALVSLAIGTEIKSSKVENKEFKRAETEIIQYFEKTFLIPAIVHLIAENIPKNETESNNAFIIPDQSNLSEEVNIHIKENNSEIAVFQEDAKRKEQINKLDQKVEKTSRLDKNLATLIAGILLLREDTSRNNKNELITELPQHLETETIPKQAGTVDLKIQKKESSQNFKETFLIPGIVNLIEEVNIPKTENNKYQQFLTINKFQEIQNPNKKDPLNVSEMNINSLIVGIQLMESDLTSNVNITTPEELTKSDDSQDLKETFFTPAIINLIEVTIESIPEDDKLKPLVVENSEFEVFQEDAKRAEQRNKFDQRVEKEDGLENNLATLFAAIILLLEDTSHNIKPEQNNGFSQHFETKTKAKQADVVDLQIQEKESIQNFQETFLIPGIINLVEKINEPEIVVQNAQLKKPETTIPQIKIVSESPFLIPAVIENIQEIAAYADIQNTVENSPQSLSLGLELLSSSYEKPDYINVQNSKNITENFLFKEQFENISEKSIALDIGLQVLQLPEVIILDQESESDYSFLIPAILNLTEALNKTNPIEPSIESSTEFVKDFNNDSDVIEIEFKTEVISMVETIVVPAFIYLTEEIKPVPDSLLLNKHSQTKPGEESLFINQPEAKVLLTIDNSENIKIEVISLEKALVSSISTPDQNMYFDRNNQPELEMQILKSLYLEATLKKINLENVRISNFFLKAEINKLKILVLILMNLLKYSESEKKFIYQLLKINYPSKISIETKIHWQSGILFNLKKTIKKKKSINGMIYQYCPKLHLSAGPLVTLDQFVPK